MKGAEDRGFPTVKEIHEAYRVFADNANEAMCIVQDGHICFSSPGALRITGSSTGELRGAPLTRIVHPRDRERVRRLHLRLMAGAATGGDTCNYRIVDTSGNVRWLEVKAVRLCWQGKPAALIVAGDVSAAKKARDDLRAREKESRKTRIMLKHKEREALLKSGHMEEMKRAHRWMLTCRDDALSEMRKNMFFNIHENIVPLLRQLKVHHGDRRTDALVDLVRMNLCEIMSPITKNMTINEYNLTRQERQIALLIRQGFKTREIAGRLGLSERSVDHHRYKIRDKLGLRHTKSNLRTVLLSLGRE